MARCGCSSECVCSISPSACIAVSGNGSTGAPFVLAPIIDPDLGNTLTCGPDGLLVPLIPFAVDDTSCIEVSGTGTVLDPLLISPVIDPDLDNILECGIAGLLATVIVADTDCITLSGNGTAGSPLFAQPVIPGSAGNILFCTPSGLVAGGADFKTWITNISTAPNIADIRAHTLTYLATLP
jgi:hypothetical protein